jgi:branched-chain amino acid transport system substrate-binding protein
MRVASLPESFRRLLAIAACLSIGTLAACTTTPPPPPPPVPEAPPAPHQVFSEQPQFFRLPNVAPEKVPVRVGVILPFGNSAADVRALAKAMMNAAELALYDSGNSNIVLMTAEDTGGAGDAAAAAQKLLDQGAEVIVGPVFSASVAAVAPLARDRGVPVLAFSTDRSVAGNGIYLLSFQPQNEVQRIIAYAASQGLKKFGAMIPQTPYGALVEQSFREAVAANKATICDVEHFDPKKGIVTDQAAAIAKADCDSILVPAVGAQLRGVVSTFAYSNIDTAKVKLLGTGLWNEPANARDALLNGAWFAAPQPSANDTFIAKYRQTFGTEPQQLAALSYDAVSLVALLANGTPYHRYTLRALTDANGFSGVDGIFRFHPDGSIERGLAVLAVAPGGFVVANPAPTTFQAAGS